MWYRWIRRILGGRFPPADRKPATGEEDVDERTAQRGGRAVEEGIENIAGRGQQQIEEDGVPQREASPGQGEKHEAWDDGTEHEVAIGREHEVGEDVREPAAEQAGVRDGESAESVAGSAEEQLEDGKLKDGVVAEADERSGTPEDGGECEVVIGLDFGTSSTKVVMRTPDLAGERAVAVDFGELGEHDNACLLPSRLWVDKDGGCRLEGKAGMDVVENIKVDLMGDEAMSDSDSPAVAQAEMTAVAYLALVLARTRRWFVDDQRDIVGHFTSFRWSVNLGVPSPHVEGQRARRFERVGTAAWMLSERLISARSGVTAAHADAVALDEAAACLRSARSLPHRNAAELELTCEELAIVPEIVGGAVGYAWSKLRKDGLHLVIDVGASTMDVCSLLLTTRKSGDQYALCTTDVHMLGAHRYENSSEQERACLQTSCDRELRRVVKRLRTGKAPLAPNEPVWEPGGRLPVLLIGGGSRIPFYEDRVMALGVAIKKDFRVTSDGVERIDLPIPESIRRNEGEFHRLVVAWGLSYRADDIGLVVPCDRDGVKPIIRRIRPITEEDT